LKCHYPELRLVVLSVHDDPIVVAEARSAGAVGFVLKRTVGTDLLSAVREVLAGGMYVSPAVRGMIPMGNDDITQQG
jgi:DNA-binding NarL/FixJ family response regulator